MNRNLLLIAFFAAALYWSSYVAIGYYQAQMLSLSTNIAQLQNNLNSLEKHPIQDGDLTKYDINHGTTISSYAYIGARNDFNDVKFNRNQKYSSSVKGLQSSCLQTNSCNSMLIDYTKELKDDTQNKISLIKDVLLPIFNGVMIILISGLIIFICRQCYICWNSNRS